MLLLLLCSRQLAYVHCKIINQVSKCDCEKILTGDKNNNQQTAETIVKSHLPDELFTGIIKQELPQFLRTNLQKPTSTLQPFTLQNFRIVLIQPPKLA